MLKLQTPNHEDKVLLHSCCAPCSSAIIECLLANGIRPTVFYYNPNIYPQAEYEIRKAEAIRYVQGLGLDFIDGDYDYSFWRTSMQGMEPPSTVSPCSPLPSPLPAGKASIRSTKRDVEPLPFTPEPLSGHKTGEKEDYKTDETSFSKSMISITSNIAVVNSVCEDLNPLKQTEE